MLFVAFDDISYSIIFVSGCYLDLSMVKLQAFPVKLNPDRQEI